MTYERFEVVLVPFPYADSAKAKRRPALIISGVESFDGKIGHSICAMITSLKNKSWPFDVEITELDFAGLPAPSVVRMKLFTIDHKIIIGKIGQLAKCDLENVANALQIVLGFS